MLGHECQRVPPPRLGLRSISWKTASRRESRQNHFVPVACVRNTAQLSKWQVAWVRVASKPFEPKPFRVIGMGRDAAQAPCVDANRGSIPSAHLRSARSVKSSTKAASTSGTSLGDESCAAAARRNLNSRKWESTPHDVFRHVRAAMLPFRTDTSTRSARQPSGCFNASRKPFATCSHENGL